MYDKLRKQQENTTFMKCCFYFVMLLEWRGEDDGRWLIREEMTDITDTACLPEIERFRWDFTQERN